MIRPLLALFALLLVGAAPVDWTKRVAATPQGGFVIGNPAAKVRLVEYFSSTCSHCAHFHAAAKTSLRRDYIATGRVAFELRNLILNGPDLAASTIARCDGAGAFFARTDRLLSTQESWLKPYGAIDAAAQARYEAAPEGQKLLALAQVGGLDRFATTALGVPMARVRACLTNKPAIDRLVAATNAARQAGVAATPTFFLNGQRLDSNVWPGVEMRLRAALNLQPKGQ